MSETITHVKSLLSTGEGTFMPKPEWCGRLSRDGIRCSHCESIRPDMKEKLREIVLEHIPQNRVLGRVLLGGLIIRQDLAELVGQQKLERLCLCLPVRDVEGAERRDLQFIVERRPRGTWRGARDSRIGLCQECGRLLYWPMGKRYLLRRYWDGSDAVTVMGIDILCTPGFFLEVIGPRHLPALKAETRALADEPQDDLPIEYQQFVDEIKWRGWTR